MSNNFHAPTKARNLRASVQGERSNKKRSNGWGGGFRDRLHPPKDEGAFGIFGRGSYEDLRPEEIKNNGGEPPINHYHVHRSHVIKANANSFRDGRCAASYDDTSPQNTCQACHELVLNRDKRISAKDSYSMNFLETGLFRKEKSVDKDGNVRRFNQDGEHHKRGDIIMDFKKVTKPRDTKEVLADLDTLVAAGNVRLYQKRYIQVGFGHLMDVMDIDKRAGKFCACGGKVTAAAFNCTKCEELLCDVEEANFDVPEAEKYADQRQKCDSCGHNDFPTMIVVCDTCDSATPLTLFDVVVKLRKSGEGTQTKLNCDEIIPLTEFTLADGSYLIEVKNDEFVYENGRPKFREDIAKIMTQFDFDKVHQPRTNEWFAKELGVQVTVGGGGSRQGDTRRYGRDQNEGGNRGSAGRQSQNEEGTDEEGEEKEEVEQKEEPKRPARPAPARPRR